MKLGIMGGTFNPPHRGHLEAARHVRDALDLTRVLFIPTNTPPHKSLPHGSATTEQRCEMVRLMLKAEPWAALSTIEADRGGASYTIDTLRALRAQDVGEKLTLIVGTDMLMTLDRWRAPAEICRLAGFGVVARAEEDRAALQEQAAKLQKRYKAEIRLIDCPVLPVSSTALRTGRHFDGLVSTEVAQYIEENRLYR